MNHDWNNIPIDHIDGGWANNDAVLVNGVNTGTVQDTTMTQTPAPEPEIILTDL